MPGRVAVVNWAQSADGIAQAIAHALAALGYEPVHFHCAGPIPAADVVFSYAPYGPLLPLAQRIAQLPVAERPRFVHWNTEGMPDLRLPWPVMRSLSRLRSAFGRRATALDGEPRPRFRRPPLSWIDRHFLRYRYVGDYHYAHARDWLNGFADTSAVYAALHNRHGLPTQVAPWGASPLWYADLALERDIDVLWMGKHASRRRRRILQGVRQELRRHGVEMAMFDNEERPFVFGDERTRLLNRTKIVLNVTRTWYDDNLLRFVLAAPNRALILSEPILPHCPAFRPGVHYVEAPVDQLAQTALHYLGHEDERCAIAQNAYQLTTTQLTFEQSVAGVLEADRRASGQQVKHAHCD